MSELVTRDFDAKVNDEKREVDGLAVTFNTVINAQVTTRDGKVWEREAFDRGAIRNVEGTKLFWNHKEVIGRVVRGEDTEAGFQITASISDTTAGRDAYTLLKDGVVDKFSVGFLPVAYRNESGTAVHTEVDLKEVSLVPFPAYAGASVTELRSVQSEKTQNKENTMDNNTEIVELRSAIEGLGRQVELLGANEVSKGESTVEFRSLAEVVSGLGKNDEAAKAELRAYAGMTTENDGITRPGWVNKTLSIVQDRRTIAQLFNRAGLPAGGNTFEYPVVTGTPGVVGEQVNEGDDLPYSEVTVDTKAGTIKTYGGYTSLSRQAIERSDVSMLDLSLRNLVNKYAQATEAAVVAEFKGATGVNTGTLAAHTAKGWLDLVLGAKELVDVTANGAQAELILVSHDVFVKLATIVDSTGRPVFVINGDGVNSVGSVDVRNTSAVVAGLPVVVGRGIGTGQCYVVSREAVTVFENGIASLQDENIINLTKDFSVYGYMGVAVTNPLGIVKVTLPA